MSPILWRDNARRPIRPWALSLWQPDDDSTLPSWGRTLAAGVLALAGAVMVLGGLVGIW